MGDRCAMLITCREIDVKKFQDLGFYADYEPEPGLAEMRMDEANYALYGELPEDIPYVGDHGPGMDYGAARFCCDGKTLVYVPETDNEIALPVHLDKPEQGASMEIRDGIWVEQEDIDNLLKYQRVLSMTRVILNLS